MERQRGGEDYGGFNCGVPNNHNPISSYSSPSENHNHHHPGGREEPRRRHQTYWDPYLVFQNPPPMLPSHLYQNPNPIHSQSNSHNHDFFPTNTNGDLNNTNQLSLNNSDVVTDHEAGQQNQLAAALNRLNISNNMPAHPSPNHHQNQRGNGFTTQFTSPNHVQNEENYFEMLKNQYASLSAQMNQYMRLHGSPYVNDGAVPQSWLVGAGPRDSFEVGPTYTRVSSWGGSSSTSRSNNLAQISSSSAAAAPHQFGGYGYRPNNSILSRRGSSRYQNGNGNGSGRHRLGSNYSSSSLEQRVMATTSNGNGNGNGSSRASRIANGSLWHQNSSNLNLSLEDLKGQIALVAKDHVGSRFLQKKLEEGNPEELEMIFSEVMEAADLRELMVDQFGNEFVQKLVEATKREEWQKILQLVMSDEKKLKDLCTDQHGSRAMQKLVERVQTREQQSTFMRLLKPISIALSKTQPGFYVIQACLKHFFPESIKGLLELVLENCVGLAKDKFGCCLVQNCIQYGYTEAKERLVAHITQHARVLSEDPFGNYVVQYVIGLKIPHVTAGILAELGGSFVTLSMNKHGSNVVEKILKDGGEEHVNWTINEMIHNPNFLNLLQDPYGNYVAQSAMGWSKGAAHNALVQHIRSHYAYLHSHLYGKRVLDKTRGHRHRC